MKQPRTGTANSFPLRASVRRGQRGFALVISLSLMVLLTVLSVGLLSLSALSLAATGREADLAEARANARMSLALAIAQLQKQTGPDQRVTVPADQLADGDGGESSAAAGQRHWTGVYRSWGSAATQRPSPQFLSWLVSGERAQIANVASAKSPAGGDKSVKLVGPGTVGDQADGEVRVPALTVQSQAGGAARLGWWTGDQGTKAAMATPPANDDGAVATIRSSLQGAPRNAVELAATGQGKPFADLAIDDPRVALVTDWKQSAFLATDKDSPRGLFHDLAPFSSGLLTNLRTGGFRKDLSMQLERPATSANSQLVSSRTALYKVSGENGINLHELWAYYNFYKEVRNSGSHRFTTGGNLGSGTPHLLVESSPAACVTDDEFFFKLPVIISYQMVLSLESRMVNGQNLLHIVSDPVITFWNPLDVAVVVPTTSFFSIKYFAIPYDVVVNIDGVNQRCPLIRSFTSGDSNFISLVAGNEVQQLVFKPGEVIKVSQSGNMIVRSGNQTDHRLQARAGFNFGGGISYPLRNENGQTIALKPTSTVRYEARPNAYTGGQTGSSGEVPPGYSGHTRHFSITHHETYVGFDRKGDAAGSLGYGGMYMDWDFGNRRLKPGEVRAQGQAGTKPANERMRANQHPDVFREITPSMGRPLSAAQLAGSKSPIMILSYNAKTEGGTDPVDRTRYLGRFNPRAHHVDFYDLSRKERDLLPYEYTVDPLVSWKNRSLETSTTGNAYFGGGMNADLGNSFVSTHSVPKEPIVSLAALQHSCANGFEILRPTDGYATLNGREPMLPQVSHAIGNSVAPPVLAPGQTEGTLSGGRPIADHSYLANLNLWDDWFFSGITPQDSPTYGKKRDQKKVAEEFLKGEGTLPVTRYQPDAGGSDPAKLLSTFFSREGPTDAATRDVASLIRVDGLFNVNSTSVEAWKSVLGSLKGREIIVRSDTGGETIRAGEEDKIPVAGLLAPTGQVADAKDGQLKSPEQWTGRRVLDEDEIEQLARAIVKEVRKRGPFLSLADFVNRRPGSDKDLARAGAIQSALDSEEVAINASWQEGDRAVSSTVASRFAFPEAEQGPSGYGMPGIVKQADILTPIAPILSARSDSFIIRAYGESVDKDGKVLARAWCEATVERDKEFVDASEKAETPIASLKSNANKSFGRRYEMTSFRWLHPDEV